ncbi:UbiA family prenyltransferase|uniref:4-hydroxybenzoate polyprenyltransferase n=1 Tax=Dendrosporobacter quercicolus TaxID=146817 RepID=A0A1G9N454_9FIRM|nr:UbiA-like polyprenyltransferase [Dendrosporobacter quercicolus]NSL47226.1 UbiA family prenyltransferase [Dendrosporobacter quercicolus DSM 1736]SDL81302.1 4-hydroxybenzoate polyprenyltransferase [Dendrosporobacter quercicolus]
MDKIKAHLENIAFSHSVFALPFAYMGASLAAEGLPGGRDLLWITLAMIGARSAALALNNFIDLKYDRIHPRFQQRPMVTGAVKVWEAIVLIAVSLAVFIVAAANLHPVCLKLTPVAIIPLAVYPYMKRFSWTCHLILGLALSIAPIGAWMAIRGELTLPIVFLGLAVGIWIAAFDVIYGCQDIAFDQQHGLNSMPVRFGVAGALKLAKLMHGVSIASFVLVGLLFQLNLFYYTGVLLAGVVLIYQHLIISPQDLTRVTQGYFMRNGLVGILVCLFTLVSLLF